jgi:hypothetical protein
MWSISPTPVKGNTFVLIGEKHKTQETTRKPEVFKGKGRVIRGEHRII